MGRQKQGLLELTRREHEVRACILRGMTNREIAAHLSLDIKTIESHVGRIYDKAVPPLSTRGPARRIEYLMRIFGRP